MMLEDIWSDILSLIALYEKKKGEYDAVVEQLRQSEALVEKYRKQIVELERQIDNLKLKNAFLSTSGDEEAKEKIDRLIREIDRCIALIEG